MSAHGTGEREAGVKQLGGRGGRVALRFGLCLSAALGAGVAQADQFHYNNVLVGTRAVGMGGAFGAVSDDASGLHYNPAGLAFALSNDIQGSANAFYQKKTIYEKAVGNEDFVEESAGSLSPFFGGLQKLDRWVPGMAFAFGVYYVDGDLKDQDTLLENEDLGDRLLNRYHRTSNARAGTFYGGAAVGYRPAPFVAVGFGLNYFNVDELVQEFQGVVQSQSTTQNGVPATVYQQQSVNVRERLTVHGIQPVLGVQFALPANLAIGLTVKQGFLASDRLDMTNETHISAYSSLSANQTEEQVQAINATHVSNFSRKVEKEAMGGWPLEARLGFAWFATPTLLWALDITHHGAVEAPKLTSYSNKARYTREAVTNYHTGVEWYVTPSLPLRLGLFTNNDASPKIQRGDYNEAEGRVCSPQKNPDFFEKYCSQRDHIDYVGESLFIAWVQPNSQIAAGVILQQGKGEAQKTGDHVVQNVKASSMSFAFSATHNL